MGKIRYTILLSLITISLLLSCNKNNGYTSIKGTLSNLTDKEILITYFLSDSLVIDTIYSNQQGKFSYKCVVDTITSFSLYFNNQNSSIKLFAQPDDNITVKGDVEIADLMKIHGNEINDDLTEFKEENESLLTKRNLLYYNMTFASGAVQAENNTTPLADADDQTKLNSINLQLLMAAEEFIIKNPNRLSSLILISEFFANSENSEAFERIMSEMKPEILKTKMGLNLTTYLKKIKRSAEGVSMPYFSLIDIKGDTINSYDFKGKHLLLSFVSATGAESRANVKLLKDAYKNINKDSVKFISIYIDAEVNPKEYIDNDSIEWTIVPEKRSWASDIVDAYNIEFVPNNILISPNGNIDSRNIPASAVSKALKNSAKK